MADQVMADSAATPPETLAESRPESVEQEWVAARRQRLLGSLDMATLRGIEIGPLAMPLARRPAAAHVSYVDYMDQAALRAKYQDDPNVRIADIVAVDALWGERTLAELFASEPAFDYIIASHVIEHVPDVVGWLHEMAAVLAPGGRVYLAIPDRRYTFDYYRRTSSLADFLGAHLGRSRRPTPAQVFDQGAYFSNLQAPANWKAAPDAAAHLGLANLRQALEVAKVVANTDTYCDVHCWVFTPRSALEVFLALVDLGLLPFRCSAFQNTPHDNNDLLLVLQKIDPADPEARQAARDSFARELEGLMRETDGNAPTDEPSLALALARQQPVPPPGPAPQPNAAPPWRSAVTPNPAERSLARGAIDLARSLLRSVPRHQTAPQARVLRSAQPVPEPAQLGRSFATHGRIYDYAGDVIDADHRAISTWPTSGGLIQLATPGFLRPAVRIGICPEANRGSGLLRAARRPRQRS